jgi:hypothetical protein
LEDKDNQNLNSAFPNAFDEEAQRFLRPPKNTQKPEIFKMAKTRLFSNFNHNLLSRWFDHSCHLATTSNL